MRIWVTLVMIGLFLITVANTATIVYQSKAIDKLVEAQAKSVKFDAQMLLTSNEDYAKIWDLHRRVLALENETGRLEAHIRWFVMRRSGTDELRKMEAAMAKLEDRGD